MVCAMREVRLCHLYLGSIELSQNRSKGEKVKHGGSKPRELLCTKPWWINTDINMEDSVKQNTLYSCVHALNQTKDLLQSDWTIENIA